MVAIRNEKSASRVWIPAEYITLRKLSLHWYLTHSRGEKKWIHAFPIRMKWSEGHILAKQIVSTLVKVSLSYDCVE